MDIAQLKTLSSLINSSITQLEEIQATASTRSETDTKFEFLKPSLQIVAAASQIVATVRTPERYLMDLATGFHVSASLWTAAETHVVEVLREFGKGPNKALSLQEISALNHVNPSKLGRVLRLLATSHVFEEVAPNVFANNVNSLPMDTGKSLSELQAREVEQYDATNGITAIIGLFAHDGMHNSVYLADVLKDPATTNSFDPYDAPFSRAWAKGAHLNMFEWLQVPENIVERKRYQVAMHGLNQLVPPDAMLRGFDFSALPAGAVIVDCGGGIGSVTMPVVKAVPHVRLIVQDMAAVIAEGPVFWEFTYPSALTEDRVSFQAHNLFDPQPASNSTAAIFLVRMVMHGWPDAECSKILNHLRDCIGSNKDARVLIIDNIMLYASRQQQLEGQDAGATDPEAVAPEPLLANWGAANSLSYRQDINMLCNHNASERTLAEFAALLSRSGFRVVQVFSAHQSWLPQILAAPV